MKKTFLMLAISAAVLSSCGEKKTDGATDSTKTEVKEEAKEITLKEYKGEKLGFTIQAPEGAKELQNNDMMWTYSLVLPDGMNEINVTVVKSTGELPTIEDAIKFTVFGEEPKIKDKKVIGEDFLVVKEPQGTLQETWYFVKGKEGFWAAKCTTPVAHQPLAEKIVTSLKAAK